MKNYIFMRDEEIWIREHRNETQYIFDSHQCDGDVVEEAQPGIFAAERTTPPAAGSRKINIRELYDQVGAEAFNLAGRSHQLLHWRRTHKYCGACGSPLVRDAKERAMRCQTCSRFFYPRVNPVVITLIHKDNSILLAKRTDPGFTHFWSVIAGFVEAGESLEHAATREIKEEVGINVKKPRFISSQPWPFPNNLMSGFYAEYDSGVVQPDGIEIAEARWFTKDDLPHITIPSKVSIARHLIESFFAPL